MSTMSGTDIYYDPYDFQIDEDPYPLWKRMRDEAPLYYNEKYDFYALTRYDDVEKCLLDWETYRSGRGSILELIRADFEIPPGTILFEDPPIHDLHRGLLSRVFTPRKMEAIEPQVRAFCARTLDPFVGADGFDFVRDLGAEMPMRVIGMLLGIPEQDQVAIRERLDEGLRLDDGDAPPTVEINMDSMGEMWGAYIDWRADHPSDDLMTALMTAEFEDETGTVRRLTRTEILNYVNLIAGAGNETTARLIGFTGKLLAEHPDQRRAIAADRALVPQAIEEVLRFEPPSPIQSRYVARDVEHYGRRVAEGSVMVLINASATRDERRFPDGDRFDIHRETRHHLSFGYGIHFCLGAALARLEGRIALDEVLQRWTDWEVDYEHAVQSHTSTARGWEELPVITS